MEDFDVTKPSPGEATIDGPGKVILNYRIDGVIGSAITIVYSLDEQNNVIFENNEKTVVRNDKLTNSSLDISQTLGLLKKQEGRDVKNCFITITVTDDASGLSGTHSFQITFK